MVTHPDGSIWFVETSTNALGRIDRDGVITEHRVPTPDASLRGVTVASDGLLWFTENAANRIGCMAPDGRWSASIRSRRRRAARAASPQPRTDGSFSRSSTPA